MEFLARLDLGLFSIELARRSLRRCDMPLKMTDKEADLTVFLFQNPSPFAVPWSCIGKRLGGTIPISIPASWMSA